MDEQCLALTALAEAAFSIDQRKQLASSDCERKFCHNSISIFTQYVLSLAFRSWPPDAVLAQLDAQRQWPLQHALQTRPQSSTGRHKSRRTLLSVRICAHHTTLITDDT